jgi:nucleotide-binding universal stress UspA family protein
VSAYELGNDGPSVIVAAVDGSATSLRAGAYAAGLARRQGATLAVVFVHALGSIAMSVPGAVAAMNEANRSTSDDLRETVIAQGRERGVQIEFYERQGIPFNEIVALAQDLKADAVVVGASMQAGHRIVGSLALHLVRAAKWPVTVVP